MKVDMDKFLICDKAVRRIYGKRFGFITIKCMPKEFNVRYDINPIGSTRSSCYPYERNETSTIENIYIVYEKDVQKEGKRVKEYVYNKYSLNDSLLESVKFALKKGDKYYRITDNSFIKVMTLSHTNSNLLRKIFGVNLNGSVYAFKLKEILEKEEWVEDEENECKEISNIKYFTPGKKVFVNSEEGGEGVILGLKEFCFNEKKAIFEVKLYDGRIIDVNFFGETEKDSYGREKTVKTLNAIEKKDNVQKSELQILNDSLCEDKLNPFVRCIPNGLNIYWQPVEKAAGYTVELYSWWEESVADKLYLMEKRSIERNIFYATFINLSHGMYYVRVIAEDRKGEKIAVNKAINMKI